MAALTTAAKIRSVEQSFLNETDFPDATLEGWAENHGDPVILARLSAASLSINVSSPGDLISHVSALLASAHGLESYISQYTGSVAEAATTRRERAYELLDQIVAGKLDIGLTAGTGGQAVTHDTDDDILGSTPTVIGDEQDW